MAPYNCHTLLIDAGHGGVDGGAVSADGLKESDVNLAIALRMSGLCDLVGIGHQLTRESDVGCLESESYSEHDDLVARAQMANSIPECVLISVHQNKYPSDIVRGAEIMYAQTPESKELGVITQSNMVSALDPENRRVAHSAPSQLRLHRASTARPYWPSAVLCQIHRRPDSLRMGIIKQNSGDAYCVIHSV